MDRRAALTPVSWSKDDTKGNAASLWPRTLRLPLIYERVQVSSWGVEILWAVGLQALHSALARLAWRAVACAVLISGDGVGCQVGTLHWKWGGAGAR